MKKWILASGLLVMISLSSEAQQRGGERPTPEQRATRMTERMAEELGLSADQKAKILEINLAEAKERKENQVTDAEARKAAMQEKRAELQKQDEQIKAILTEEQQTKWEEIKLKAKDDRRRPDAQIEDGAHLRKRRGGGK